jgi:hypothetical protein
MFRTAVRPQIVKEQSRHSGSSTDPLPCLAKVTNRSSLLSRKDMLSRLLPTDALGEQLIDQLSHNNRSSFRVLGCPRFKSNCPRDEINLLHFCAVRLTRAFTNDSELIRHDLQNLHEGDGGAAILDAIQYSIQLLRSTPRSHRRVLLLISETRDHGSKIARLDDVVASVGDSSAVICALTFSPSWSQVLDTERGSNRDEWGNQADLLAPILMARQSLRRNTPKAVATMTGGEYQLFASLKEFERLMTDFTNHVQARYVLSFQPEDPRPGLHHIRVRLVEGKGGTVQARSTYWAVGTAH